MPTNPSFVEPILHMPVSQLEFSREFILLCELYGFETLSDLLGRHMSELVKLPGFTLDLWNEFASFLEQRRLGHYLNGA